METILINAARTENGYSASCDLLPGWVVACSGDFKEFCKEVRDSILFYVECAQADGMVYPPILDEDYDIRYKFIGS